MLEKHLSYQYPYEADILLHTKMSVSELKKQGQLTDESESVQTEALEERKEDEEEPKTAGTKRRGKGGAVKGTAYHRAMELLPLDRINSRFEAEACLKQLVEEKRYTKRKPFSDRQPGYLAFSSVSVGKKDVSCVGRGAASQGTAVYHWNSGQGNGSRRFR